MEILQFSIPILPPESKMDIFKNVQNWKIQKEYEKTHFFVICDENALKTEKKM